MSNPNPEVEVEIDGKIVTALRRLVYEQGWKKCKFSEIFGRKRPKYPSK